MRMRINIPFWYKKDRLKDLRKQFGYTQTEVADQIGCVLKTYQNYEQGHNYPTIEYAARLAELYGVSIDYVLGRSEFTSIENEKISELTGLDEKAINFLRELNALSKADPNLDMVSALNTALSFDKDFLSIRMLHALNDLFNSEYRIPCFATSESETITTEQGDQTVPKYLTPTYSVPGTGAEQDYFLTLAKDKETPWDNKMILMGSNFFEGIAMNQMTTTLHDMLSEYKKRKG